MSSLTTLVLCLLATVAVCGGALDVRVSALPSSVIPQGHSVTFVCEYELHGAPLYSVKWYRGQREFYRFVPQENPAQKQKIFPFPGLNIDLSQSDERRVHITKVNLSLAGSYSCEVSADAPSFSTAFVSQQLTVVVLPPRRPILNVEMPDYEVGDVLQANCSTAPSRPAANLTFYVNNMPIFEEDLIQYPIRIDTDGLESSRLGLSLKLRAHHFDPAAIRGPALHIRCDARILSVYADSARLTLRPKSQLITSAHTTQPKHERGKRKFTSNAVASIPSSRQLALTLMMATLLMNF